MTYISAGGIEDVITARGFAMARRLFCEIHPVAYQLSAEKEKFVRRIRNLVSTAQLAKERGVDDLPTLVYRHNSLIRRRLGNVDVELQENKAVSLSVAAPKVDRILIRPGETFSFWSLVGPVTARRGYREGLTISNDRATRGIGGGLCQFTNLLHWMVLHSPLEIVEHHHHGRLDLFPDFNRQIPFGTGTSIIYNYLDYRVLNATDQTYQLRAYVTDEHICGELRAERALDRKFHVHELDAYFYRADGKVHRHNRIVRTARDKATGQEVLREEILENDALVCYDEGFIAAPILDEKPVSASVPD